MWTIRPPRGEPAWRAAAADVAAVLLRLKPTDQRTMISRIKALAPAIQDGGAALLLDGHVELVARAGADGAHLTGIAAIEEALPSLKPDRIAGVGGLATRHDSMAAGEARRGLRAVRRARCAGAATFGRGDRRTPAMVGRIVRAALRRLCRARARRPPNSPRPAPISCWSAISSGPIRAAPAAALTRCGTGDPASARRGVRKSQGRSRDRPEMKHPASDIDAGGVPDAGRPARRRKRR